MKFSNSVQSTANPPVPEAASWLAGREFPADLPLLDLSQAVPDYPTAPVIREHLSSLSDHAGINRYDNVLGIHELREAYADKVCRHYKSDKVTFENVAISAGCNQAFHVAATSLVAPGDEVILVTPWYFNHKMTLDMLGAVAVPLHGDLSNNLQPQARAAVPLINAKTRAIVLISPNNPTGQIYSAECINDFYQLCRQHDLALIIDETYVDFRPQLDQPAHDCFDDPDWQDTLVHLYSFSKAYSLAGYRVGALVCGKALMQQVNKVMDCLIICAPLVSQHAALCGLQNAAQWQAEKRDMMANRAAAFARAFSDAIANKPDQFRIAAMGTYFAYIEHPTDVPSKAVARALVDYSNLLCLPGEMFGPGQEKYLRFAFANVESSLMPQIAQRLAGHSFQRAMPVRGELLVTIDP